MGLPAIGGAVGIPGLIILLLSMFLGGGGGGGGGFDVGNPLEQLPQSDGATGNQLDGAPDPEAATVDFVSFVLDDVQQHWERLFSESGRQYERAELVLFEDAVNTGCGSASSATGPFYCPLDKRAYIDLGFFRELRTRFQAPGDFAQAYVLSHEIAHHVQNITGINPKVRQLQQRNPDDANELSVRQELQADCLAGVWAHSTYERGILEQGDLEEGLGAAAAVGDDRIQREATGRVNPETWTHGSSEQRMDWFNRGYETGDPDNCDTFEGKL